MFRDLNVDELGKKFRAAQPFPSVCIDDFLDPDVAREMARSYPSFEEAMAVGRSFKAVNEKRKVQVTDERHFPDPVKRFTAMASSPEFLAFLSKLSGIDNLLWDDTYSGGGMHQTASSGRLDVHVDFNKLLEKGWYRRLNLLFFLNEGWDDAWGGRIELWDPEVKKCWHSLEPIFNRMVIFETSETSYHGVTPIRCPENVARRSFALYFYTETAPPGVVHAHSTVFKARPHELGRRFWLMPVEAAGAAFKRVVGRGKSAAKRLLNWKRAPST